MSIVEQLGDRIAALKPDEAKELRLLMKERWGVEPAGGGIIVQQEAQAPPPQQVAPEATEFNVILAGFEASKKIGVIKVAREITGLGLVEAKLLVETARKAIKEGVSKIAAEDIRKRMEEAGAKVEVEPVT